MDASIARRTTYVLPATVLVAVGTAVVTAGWTGPVNTSVLTDVAVAWGTQGAIALLWVGMALGFGVWIAAGLGIRQRRGHETIAISLGLGVAAALTLDALLGWLGILLLGRGMGAWGMTIAGLLLLVLRVRSGGMPRLSFRPTLPVLGVAVPIGILLVASASAPGWLWRSEFGGYDTLSYHLQLPKEWIVAGGVTTLPHNVYSAFPSFVESAFLHLFILAGGESRGAIAAQCLAALITLGGAWAVAALARRVAGDLAAALAAALYLATPWTIVVGSLAYNDGFIGLLLAVGLLLVGRTQRSAWQSGAALGLLLGAACGAKLTAAGFVLAPVLVALVLRRKSRAVVPIAGAAVMATVVLLPWLLRNLLATGSPTFPFASNLFGNGWWTAEQVAIFRDAHSRHDGLGAAIGRLWSQWFAFGIGAAPSPFEPWIPQWSAIPAVGMAGLLVGWFVARLRRARFWPGALAAVLAVELLFWLVATHLQSRFLLPTAVPLAVGAALLLTKLPRAMRPLGASAAAVLASIVPLVVYSGEGIIPTVQNGTRVDLNAPALFVGAAAMCTGDGAAAAIRAATDDATRTAVQQQAPLSFFLNHLLPADDRILLVGDAKPFWYRRSSATLTYTTVWDRGPLSEVARANPEHPEQWAEALTAKGYTWLVLDWAMLSNWGEKGWLDPELTKDRFQRFAATLPIVKQFPGGVELRALRLSR